jgi:hypothetical protein
VGRLLREGVGPRIRSTWIAQEPSMEGLPMPNRDVRIPVEFPTHRKTRELIRLGGAEAFVALIKLWIWVAQNRWADGDLGDFTATEINGLAGYTGKADFAAIAERVGFLDRTPAGGFRLHDWAMHQSYCAGLDARIAQAKKAVTAREMRRGPLRVAK